MKRAFLVLTLIASLGLAVPAAQADTESGTTPLDAATIASLQLTGEGLGSLWYGTTPEAEGLDALLHLGGLEGELAYRWWSGWGGNCCGWWGGNHCCGWWGGHHCCPWWGGHHWGRGCCPSWGRHWWRPWWGGFPWWGGWWGRCC